VTRDHNEFQDQGFIHKLKTNAIRKDEAERRNRSIQRNRIIKGQLALLRWDIFRERKSKAVIEYIAAKKLERQANFWNRQYLLTHLMKKAYQYLQTKKAEREQAMKRAFCQLMIFIKSKRYIKFRGGLDFCVLKRIRCATMTMQVGIQGTMEQRAKELIYATLSKKEAGESLGAACERRYMLLSRCSMLLRQKIDSRIGKLVLYQQLWKRMIAKLMIWGTTN
jgi:hypothetical protein